MTTEFNFSNKELVEFFNRNADVIVVEDAKHPGYIYVTTPAGMKEMFNVGLYPYIIDTIPEELYQDRFPYRVAILEV